jgi:hypothetical protein
MDAEARSDLRSWQPKIQRILVEGIDGFYYSKPFLVFHYRNFSSRFLVGSLAASASSARK